MDRQDPPPVVLVPPGRPKSDQTVGDHGVESLVPRREATGDAGLADQLGDIGRGRATEDRLVEVRAVAKHQCRPIQQSGYPVPLYTGRSLAGDPELPAELLDP